MNTEADSHRRKSGRRETQGEDSHLKAIQIDLAWETDLPKYLYGVRQGSKCLVIIYDEEEKINKARSDGRSIYSRDIYVPSDEM